MIPSGFFSEKESAKILEIGTHSGVNVSFSNPNDRQYVSISGHASLDNDRTRIDELWTPLAQVWFPGGRSDPNLALIRVQPTFAEYWDVPQGVFFEYYEMTKSAVTGRPPGGEYGEHEQIDM